MKVYLIYTEHQRGPLNIIITTDRNVLRDYVVRAYSDFSQPRRRISIAWDKIDQHISGGLTTSSLDNDYEGVVLHTVEVIQ